MPISIVVLLLGGSVCAALGQILFKVGAADRVSLAEFVNVWILFGLLFYGVGTALWIYSLSKARLTVVYPFTALTFVLVYLSGVYLFHEPTTNLALAGVALVLAGLLLIAVN
jgi:drug/metabolite transporter (DMT)-like permease